MKKLTITLSTMFFSISALAIPMSYGRPLVDLTKAFPVDNNKGILIVAFAIPLIGLIALALAKFSEIKRNQKHKTIS